MLPALDVRGDGIILSAKSTPSPWKSKAQPSQTSTRTALRLNGNMLTVNIHDNTVTGRGPLPAGDECQNGILIEDGTAGTVNHNSNQQSCYINHKMVGDWNIVLWSWWFVLRLTTMS